MRQEGALQIHVCALDEVPCPRVTWFTYDHPGTERPGEAGAFLCETHHPGFPPADCRVVIPGQDLWRRTHRHQKLP